MIGERNKENPYIIQIIESIDPANLNRAQTTQKFTRAIAIQILLSIIIGALGLSIQLIAGLIVYNIVNTLYAYSNLKSVLKKSPIPEVMRILYGNQYEKIYVNNEKLLLIIQDISKMNGQLTLLKSFFDTMTKKHVILAIFISILRIAIILLRYFNLI